MTADDAAGRLFLVKLPPPDTVDCVPRLLGWLAYPSARDHRERELLAAALIAWRWRNVRAAGLIKYGRVPAWAKQIHNRDMQLRIERMAKRLRKGRIALRIWRPVRASRIGRPVLVGGRTATIRGMAAAIESARFEASSGDRGGEPDNLRKRTFSTFLPVLHLFEQFAEQFDSRAELWDERVPGEGGARAIMDLLEQRTIWAPAALERAERARRFWHAQAGIDPKRCIEFEFAENVQILTSAGDIFRP